MVGAIAAEDGLDFLVNNAGITKKCRAEDFLWRISSGFQCECYRHFSLCQSAYPYLKESQHKGRIVNISSMAAHLGFSGGGSLLYEQAAVCGLTRGLAVEWANDNITVNSIAPGWFPSEMSKQVMTPERKQAILGSMPVHAFGDPKDLGAMARFVLAMARSISPDRILPWMAERWPTDFKEEDMGRFQEDLFLTNEMGKRLYHRYAEQMPIIDYHCHLSPKEIYENEEFEDLGEMWLSGDHYKWRVMRTFGVSTRSILRGTPLLREIHGLCQDPAGTHRQSHLYLVCVGA